MLDRRFKAACDEIGRLVVPADTPPWLAAYFMYWAPALASEWSVEQLQFPRAAMKEQLTRVVEAADALNDVLSQPVPRVFLERTHGIAIDEESPGFQDSLMSIRRYAHLAATSSAILNKAGKTKRGRGKTTVPGGLDPMDFCAVIVAEAWKFARQSYPGARNGKAAKAAQSFWRLSVGAAASRKGLSAWRQHFENAQNPEFASNRAECLHILRVVKSRP